MTSGVLIRHAEVGGRIVDVAWRDGVVVAVEEPARRGARAVGVGYSAIAPGDREMVIVDADGGALLPGLHDHHLHLLALAAARRSTLVGPPAVGSAEEFAASLSAACRENNGGWVRAIGYHESVAGPLDAERLDRLVPAGRDTAIRVQHRSGQLWMLNRRAAELVGLADVDHVGVERDASDVPTGRVFGFDAELRRRLAAGEPDLVSVGLELASYGITGVTDMTPTDDAGEVEMLARHVRAPTFPIEVTISGGPCLDPAAGRTLDRGPVKFLPIESRAIDPDELAAGFLSAHAAGRSVAVHCVTRIGLVMAIAAWHVAGVRPGDRIEHGGVIPEDLIDEIGALGLMVVTQPNFVAERGARYLVDVDTHDQPHLWRCATLLDRGVGVAAGTDAPFGHPDPWRAVVAAVHRMTTDGNVLGPDERVSSAVALSLFLGGPRRPTVRRVVRPGEQTGLCLLNRPLSIALREPTSDAVRLTVGRAGVTMSGTGHPPS